MFTKLQHLRFHYLVFTEGKAVSRKKLLSSWNNLTDSWLSLLSQTAAPGWVMRNNLMSVLRAEVGFGYTVFLSTASNYRRYNNTKTFIIIHKIGIYLTAKGLNHKFIMNAPDLHRVITVKGAFSLLQSSTALLLEFLSGCIQTDVNEKGREKQM